MSPYVCWLLGLQALVLSSLDVSARQAGGKATRWNKLLGALAREIATELKEAREKLHAV